MWECQLTAKHIEHTMREVELLLNENMLSLYRRKPLPYADDNDTYLPIAAEESE